MFAAAQYRATKVETASPVSLVVQLFDGAIGRIDLAVEEFERGDVIAARSALVRAHAIVSELQATLDRTIAPAFADQLDRLYDYVLHNLFVSHIEGRPAELAPSSHVLRDLRGAFAEIARRRS